MYRCFPSLRSRAGLTPESINEPFNAITLAEVFHTPFDELDLVFDPTVRLLANVELLPKFPF